MAIQFDITEDHGWFIGDDLVFVFEVLENDSLDVDDPAKGVVDVSGWPLVWTLKKSDSATATLIQKSTGTDGGISITGVYNSDRSANTQRVEVAIEDDDTDDLSASTEDEPYRHALKRMTNAAERVLAYGDAVLQKSTAPPTIT